MIRFICAFQLGTTVAAFVLGYFFDTGKIWHYVGVAVFIAVWLFGVWATVRFLQNMREAHACSKLARSFLSISSELDEILMLDASLTICYAKHWPVDPKDRDFSFEALVRSQFVDHNGALDACKNAIEAATYFEDVFRVAKINEWESDCFIRVRVVPLYTNATTIPTYRVIILSDVTLYMPNEIPHALVKYIDSAPFGLLYANAEGKIVGLNDTLQQWLHASKEKTIGKHISNIGITPGAFASLHVPFGKSLQVWVLTTKISDDCIALTLLRSDFPITAEMLTSLPVPSLIVNGDGRIRAMNPAIHKKYGMKISSHFGDYLDEPSQRQLEHMLRGMTEATELRLANSDTTIMTCVNKLKDEEFIFQLVDTSEQKKLEQQFIQAQKTQAIGQLAGGIAHDFNNLLTAITGFSDMLLQRIMPNDPSYADIMQIKQNANRASNLVKQLLAFSRRQSLQPRKIDVANILSDLSALLKRLIGAPIAFKLVQSRKLWSVKVDAGQFEQVIINLAVNARDAMPNGGTLSIEASNFTMSANKAPKNINIEDLPLGDYVLIKIVDTGCGIPKELMKSIFEPFFSTKAMGQGTGLGLATAYGIVRQTGGFIFVWSDVGVGTTFHIYLPRCSDKDEPVKEKKLVQDLTGTETVLLVEDDDAVRMFATKALRDRGYKVIDATNGQGAIDYILDGIRPDVLVTDVSMPGMDGPTLGKKISEIIPGLPIIFTSGYAEEAFRRDLSENKSMHFLSKPFTLRDLASKIREILE